jgi:argininosuccinate synthase
MLRVKEGVVPRIVYAFNGDLESRLALHWLVHEQGYDVLAFSANLGQGIYLEPLGELALELGASAAQVLDLRGRFLRDFCLPTLQADAVYQLSYFLGSALGRYAIARELVRLTHEEGCSKVAHSAASKGNAQIRMETAITAQDPSLEILSPVRNWGLRTLEEKLSYARRRRLPIEEPTDQRLNVDRNLWGASLFMDELVDAWDSPPPELYQMTRAPEQAPDAPVELVLGFDAGVPRSLNGKELELLPLVIELNRLGGEHGIGRSDVIEDRLYGTKSREIYEAPAPTILLAAHHAVQALVLSRDLITLKDTLGRRYADVVYSGYWFSDLRESLQGFIGETQKYVTGEVRLKLYKGTCTVMGRRSPNSIYDARLSSQINQELFYSEPGEGVTSLWTLPARLAARRKKPAADSGWPAP